MHFSVSAGTRRWWILVLVFLALNDPWTEKSVMVVETGAFKYGICLKKLIFMRINCILKIT